MKFTLLVGDVFDCLPRIASDSVDLAITSPPYWGLRNYGVEDQIGNEPTMEAYLDNLLRWTKEVYRVLKPTGSFVLNLAGCYVGGGFSSVSKASEGRQLLEGQGRTGASRAFLKTLGDSAGKYKEKQYLDVAAFAYCRIISETGFVCRNRGIWAKPNVPSPIRSRLKQSWEAVDWFVKDPDEYYWNPKPWLRKAMARDGKESFTGGICKLGDKATRRDVVLRGSTSALADNIGVSQTSIFRAGVPRYENKFKDQSAQPRVRTNNHWAFKERNNVAAEDQSTTPGKYGCGMRGQLDYKDDPKTDGSAFPRGSFHAYVPETIEHAWRVVPVGEKQQGFELSEKAAQEHIAPFPEALIQPWVESLCPVQVCAACGRPPKFVFEFWREKKKKWEIVTSNIRYSESPVVKFISEKWCACGADKTEGTALDPFLGSGTTMKVAMNLGRNSVGIELNEKSVAYAKKRLNWGQGLDCEYAEEKVLKPKNGNTLTPPRVPPQPEVK